MIIDGTFEAFMIGETFHDIKMGKNVNTSTIGVSWDYNNQEELHRKNAGRVVNDPSELVKILGEY